jgi:hypothetical protein
MADTLSTMVHDLIQTNYLILNLNWKLCYEYNGIKIKRIRAYLLSIRMLVINLIWLLLVANLFSSSSGRCRSLMFCLPRPVGWIFSLESDAISVHV